MTESFHISSNLLIAYSTCLIGTASPGPSNLAIMGTAMNAGRAQALVLASGVVTGSLMWGLLAAFGLSNILSTWSGALIVMKIFGGLYLLWLAFKAGRSAFTSHTVSIGTSHVAASNYFRLFCRGTAMHLTNPKAIFVWLSIVSMALPPRAQIGDALRIVGGCTCVASAVFAGYAIIFSTSIARSVYCSLRRWFEGTLAVAFGYAGLRMLISKASTT